MDNSNVIHMDNHHSKPVSVVSEKSARVIADCRRLVVNGLKPLVSRLFENADDVLFSMADKAENNTIQSLYFDAMRLVRIKRHDLEEGFYQQFIKLFNAQWKQNTLPAQTDIPVIPGPDSLTLIDDEDLEESLAITNMVSKAENRSLHELNALTQRFSGLASGVSITNEDLPIGPAVVCRAFRESLKTLDLGNKIKLIIYKLFDKYIIADLNALYAGTNKLLIKRGVLPDLRVTIVKSPDTPAAENPLAGNKMASQGVSLQVPDAASGAANAACMPVCGDDNMLATLQQLLSTRRIADGGNIIHMPGINPSTGDVCTSAVSCDTQGLLSSLVQVQQRAFTSPLLNKQLLSGDVTLKSLLLNEIAEQAGENTPISLNRNDEDIIDIVSMLFEFIIEDRNIPDSVKALLGRLQMTLLRVSLLDREFFSKKHHPARSLLNELSSAAIGLDDSDIGNAIYNQIKYTVNRVLEEFESDAGLFAELHEEFIEFLKQLNEPHNDFNETVDELASIQALREKTSEVVNSEIGARIDNNEIPKIVRDFLEDQWTSLLIKLHIEEGPDSSMWDNSLRVADLLIWSVKPKISLENKQKLLRLIPGLLRTLRHGMELLEYDTDEIEDTISGFQPHHTASLRGRTYDEEVTEETAGQSVLPDSPAHGVEKPALVHKNDLSYTAITPDTEAKMDDAVIEEIVLSDSLLPNDTEPATESEQKDDKYTDMVSNAAVGMWFGFTDETGRQQRARLSRITGITSRYIFVTRKSRRIIEKTFHGLAAELRRNTAHIIENVPLIDRALHAVVSGLRIHKEA